MPIAIISVYNKTGLELIGSQLENQQFIIYATKGTREYLKKHNISAKPVSSLMDNPEGFEDMFSSISFKTVVGTLSGKNEQIMMCGAQKIDLLIYNFVPTWEIIHNLKDFNIHNVDFGGPAMIRAAAINYKNVVTIVDPKQYHLLHRFDYIDQTERLKLAEQAFEYTSSYDKQLAVFLYRMRNND